MSRPTLGRISTSYRAERRLFRRPVHVVAFVVGAIVIVALPIVLQDRAIFGIPLSDTQLLGIGLPQVNLTLIAILGAIALNLLVGYTGLVSLGHAAFFAVGAAVAGFLGTQHNVPFPLVILAAGIAGAIVGFLIGLPSLRLQGLYLMLATLALHFVVIFLFMEYQISNFSPAGIPYTYPTIGSLTIDTDQKWYVLLVIAAVLLLFAVRNLLRSRQGRALVAVRDHEVAAASMGISVPRMRLTAFAVSSFIVSVIGALYAYYLGNIGEATFGLNFVIGYFAMIIIGGMGSMAGPIFGAILWSLLPQIIQTAAKQVPADTPVIGTILSLYQGYVVSVILGILILLILRFKPGGLNDYWNSLKGMVAQWPYRSK
jgi:branched-chain amino acid transport system permease protein